MISVFQAWQFPKHLGFRGGNRTNQCCNSPAVKETVNLSPEADREFDHIFLPLHVVLWILNRNMSREVPHSPVSQWQFHTWRVLWQVCTLAWNYQDHKIYYKYIWLKLFAVDAQKEKKRKYPVIFSLFSLLFSQAWIWKFKLPLNVAKLSRRVSNITQLKFDTLG